MKCSALWLFVFVDCVIFKHSSTVGLLFFFFFMLCSEIIRVNWMSHTSDSSQNCQRNFTSLNWREVFSYSISPQRKWSFYHLTFKWLKGIFGRNFRYIRFYLVKWNAKLSFAEVLMNWLSTLSACWDPRLFFFLYKRVKSHVSLLMY